MKNPNQITISIVCKKCGCTIVGLVKNMTEKTIICNNKDCNKKYKVECKITHKES